MDGRQFVRMLKRHAFDGMADDVLKSVARPSPFGDSEERLHARNWAASLSPEERQHLRALMEESAQCAIFGTLCVLDGVGGDWEGLFEVVAVHADDRSIVNPENSEMLHDLFSEECS